MIAAVRGVIAEAAASGLRRLLRVQLDDQLFLHRQIDLLAGGQRLVVQGGELRRRQHDVAAQRMPAAGTDVIAVVDAADALPWSGCGLS